HSYGHLRPGTFDIESLRYDQRPDLFDYADPGLNPSGKKPFRLTQTERDDFARLLCENGLRVSVDELLQYAVRAISGREQAKFILSKHLSDLLETIAAWGNQRGLSRFELSFLRVSDIEECLSWASRDLKNHL